MKFECSNNEFAEKISELLAEGFGITPFLGSGCSAASGIMMGQEFTDYLGHAVYICVGGKGGKGEARWDIAKKGWPETPSESEIAEARVWVADRFDTVIKEYGMRALYDPEKRVTDCRLDGTVSSPELFAKLFSAPTVPPFLRSPVLKTEDASVRSFQERMMGKKKANERIIFTHSKSETSHAAICEMAIRALSDWRATLHFIAMLRYVKTVSGSRLSIGDVDLSVIDRFNVHITKNRKPNLTHQMIAQLAMSARIRIILTTNFDRLIENAFESFGRPVSNIPVGIHGGLPHPDLVHANDCLVKLHGDCHETRADYSLDDPPSGEDKRRFFHYVRGDYPDSDDASGSHRYIPSQLLVVGYSGSDRRCNDMIKYVLDSDERAKIYWVCHSKRDIERLSGSFNESDYTSDRIIATQTERPDLLLYDIYQKLNLTLPSPGVTYHFPDRVIPARSPLPKDEDLRVAEGDAETIEGLLSTKHEDHRGAIVILKGKSGVLTVIHQTFELLRTKGKHRIWLELEDFSDAASVGAEIRTGVSVRTGSLPLGHLKPLPRAIIDREANPGATKVQREKKSADIIEAWKTYFSESCKELGITAGMWTVGLYGRNGAGGCSGWDGIHKTWEAEEYEELQELIRGLSKAGFNILYAPYTRERDARDKERLATLDELRVTPSKWVQDNEIRENLPRPAWDSISPDVTPLVMDDPVPGENVFIHQCRYRQPKQLNMERVIREVSAHILELHTGVDGTGGLGYKKMDRDRWLEGVRALYSATLFRQSRHFSAFINDAVYRCPNQFNTDRDDNDETRQATIQKWIGDLKEYGVFYTKPGGFAWAYRDVRLGIRNVIHTLHFDPGIAKAGRFIRMRNFTPGCHFYIGEWYAKAHRVTRHPLPMIEGLHHFFESIRTLPDFGSLYTGKADVGDGHTVEVREALFASRRKMIFFGAIIALLNLLKNGESSLRYWASIPLRRSMFSPGEADKVLKQIAEVMAFIFDAEIVAKVNHPANFGLLDLGKVAWSRLASLYQGLPEEGKPDPSGGSKNDFAVERVGLTLEQMNVNPRGVDYYAWTLLDDVARELRYIEKRIASDYRVTDIPFQKSIPATGRFTYEFDGNSAVSAWAAGKISGLLRGVGILNSAAIKESFAGGPAKMFCLDSRIFEIVDLIQKERASTKASDATETPLSRKIRKVMEGVNFAFLLKEDACVANPHEINLFIQSLVEWAFLYIRRAKKLYRARVTPPSVQADGEVSIEDYQGCFLTSTVFCYMAINLCRLLPPAYAESAAKEQAKAQAIYGLALGHLGRFREAYRRLGEARVLCRSMKSEDGIVLLGIAELRRAEVLCLEAREYGAVLRWLLTRPEGETVEDEEKKFAGMTEEQKKSAIEKQKKIATEEEQMLLGKVFREHVEHHELSSLDRKPPSDEVIQSVVDLLSENGEREAGEKLAAWVEGARKTRDGKVAGVKDSFPINPKAMGNILHRRGLSLSQQDFTNAPEKIRETAEKLNRVLQAKIGDAWRCLEESRRGFSGRTHSSRWWGRLYSMELRVFGEAGLAIKHAADYPAPLEWYRMLPCRNRRDLAQHLDKIWRAGIAVAGDGPVEDRYYRLKVTYIYLFALTLGDVRQPELENSAESYLDHLRLTRDEVRTGVREVLKFLEKEFPGRKDENPEDEKPKDEGAVVGGAPVGGSVGKGTKPEPYGLPYLLEKEREMEDGGIKPKKTPESDREKIRKNRDDITHKDLFGPEPEDLDHSYFLIIVKKALRMEIDVRK
ncbi:SIR2 family protein [Luteolibacter arcticus]|uniref:SIR2 family protein n=1 Tax=Luteolibacter arcticus TaxID=1581411 RepID=A0ABT3GS85_9BACT|nr:SIR2 family protein [Luteolibacter arcticus]MCW1926386.1 SIR2 family protein [Luteolibacter arcticus]